jgi:hypothetical protein
MPQSLALLVQDKKPSADLKIMVWLWPIGSVGTYKSGNPFLVRFLLTNSRPKAKPIFTHFNDVLYDFDLLSLCRFINIQLAFRLFRW